MAHLINLLATFLLMLVTGIFWGPWFALTRSLNVFEPGEFIKITNILSKNLAPTMTFLLPGTILLMAISAFIYQSSASFYLSLPAIFFLITSLIITVAIEVPIVKQVEQWTETTLPGDWQANRDRWLKFHVYRVLAALISFALWIALFI